MFRLVRPSQPPRRDSSGFVGVDPGGRWIGGLEPTQHVTERVEVPEIGPVAAGWLDPGLAQTKPRAKRDQSPTIGGNDVADGVPRSEAKATKIIPEVVQSDATRPAVRERLPYFPPIKPTNVICCQSHTRFHSP